MGEIINELESPSPSRKCKPPGLSTKATRLLASLSWLILSTHMAAEAEQVGCFNSPVPSRMHCACRRYRRVQEEIRGVGDICKSMRPSRCDLTLTSILSDASFSEKLYCMHSCIWASIHMIMSAIVPEYTRCDGPLHYYSSPNR